MDELAWYPGMCCGPGRGYTLEQARRSVGRGWSPLVIRAYELIAASGGHVSQVKEKFGSLRVYPWWDGETNREELRPVLAALAEIEDESMRTCERCGAPGWLVGRGWRKTLCLRHAERYLAGERFPTWDPATYDPDLPDEDAYLA